MFFLLSKVLDVLLSPLVWAMLLLAAAVPWRERRHAPQAHRTRLRRRLCGGAGLAVLLVASSPPVANALMWALEQSGHPTYRQDATYDAVILLGGVVDDQATAATGQPSYNDNVERLIATHELLRDGHARMGIISGASSRPELAAYGDSVVLARQLEDWGIAKDRLVAEDRALNTHENALFTKAIARARGYDRVLIVTSAFHMARAAECFAAVDMKVDTMSVDYRAVPPTLPSPAMLLPRAQSLMTTSGVLREVFGRWIYRLQGYGRPAR